MDDHIYILPGNRKRQVNLGKNWEHMIHFNFNEDMGKFHRSDLDMTVRGQFFESLCILYHETGDTESPGFFRRISSVFLLPHLPIECRSHRTFCQPVPVHRRPGKRHERLAGWQWSTPAFSTRRNPHADFLFSFLRNSENESGFWESSSAGLTRIVTGLIIIICGRGAWFHLSSARCSREIPAFTAMKDRGAAIVRRHILEDFNPSGGYSEHSIAYRSQALLLEKMLYRGIYLARLNNVSLLDQETTNRMNATFHVLAMLCPPGPRYPSLGDNGGPMTDPILNIGCRSTMKHAECEAILKIRTYNQSISDSQSPSITYDPSCNQDAPIHLPLDFCDQDAGFICSKSGYRKRDNYLLMSAKVNRGYSGHNHMDMLSLFLTMRGEEIIGEPYVSLMYHDVTMNSPQRGYMYNMASHNTVLAYGTPIVPDSMYANKWGVLRPSSPITAYFHNANGIYAERLP